LYAADHSGGGEALVGGLSVVLDEALVNELMRDMSDGRGRCIFLRSPKGHSSFHL
jgi:hypothetical protein